MAGGLPCVAATGLANTLMILAGVQGTGVS